MRYCVILIVLIALLGLSSCDRFEHAFQPDAEVDYAIELFTPLQTGFNQVTAADLAPAMAFYAEDYLHYGVTKSEWESQLHSLIAGVANPVFEVNFSSIATQNESNALANWHLKISNPATKTVLADSLYIGERLIKVNNKWLLKGNQNTCNPPVGKQRIIVEYITNIGCSYCPDVEAKLHELKAMYPNQFTYLTHQLSGPVAISDPLYDYYNAHSAPTSIIQGQYVLSSNNPEVLDQYYPLVQSLVELDTEMNYSMVSSTVSGNNVNGSIIISPIAAAFNQEFLVLNLAIVERTSTAVNVLGEPLTNVVLGRKRIDLSTADLSQPIAFTFNANVTIPADASLVVFAQRTPSPFANNAHIYSGSEFVLTGK
ncbi:MAG: hypothetical protein RBS43_08625 [Candidatus Cloacimonas sp.]|jgi:hypothetical protein|nr:hypothetical protein [Candidatus Cloacimonas sp.]